MTLRRAITLTSATSRHGRNGGFCPLDHTTLIVLSTAAPTCLVSHAFPDLVAR